MSMVESHAPDWETIADEVRCPLCEYNLRGLSELRCPECGYTFTWDEMLDDTRRLHPYIFEHHPERNLWSFVWTVYDALWPRGFWTTLHPAQPSHRKRLLLYLTIIILLASLPMVVDLIWGPPTPAIRQWTPRISLAQGFASWVPANLLCRPLEASRRQIVVAGFIAWLALPLLNYALLMIFQQTMRKAQVRVHHVQRCIVYSVTMLIWPALAVLAMTVVNLLPGNVDFWAEHIAWTILLTFPLIWLYTALHLAAAYRFYLRFDRPIATVFSVQLIIFLLLPLILYNL